MKERFGILALPTGVKVVLDLTMAKLEVGN
jgi:hypothetical protein